MDCSPPGFSVHGIFQARILEWFAFPPPDLLHPVMDPMSPALAGTFFTTEPPGKSPVTLVQWSYIHTWVLGAKWCMLLLLVSHFSCVQLCVTPWTIAHQAPLSMRFPRQEYWSGLPFPSPGDLLNPGIKPVSPAWQAEPLPLNHQGSPSNIYVASIMQMFFIFQLYTWPIEKERIDLFEFCIYCC